MPKPTQQAGYALLTMMLILTLAAIAATAAAPGIVFRLKRDQEEELIHRGVQYSRAIRRYARRNGRFPLAPEDLLGDGNIRYIRKLYKDPITGKEFRFLHLKDIPPVAGIPNVPGDSSSSPQQGDTVQQSGNGINPSSGAYKDPDATATASLTRNPVPQLTIDPQTSGGLIFGVASLSHGKTIREFNRKNHYNDWLFFYDPHYDQGHEIKGPTPLVPARSFTAQASSSNQESPSDARSQ